MTVIWRRRNALLAVYLIKFTNCFVLHCFIAMMLCVTVASSMSLWLPARWASASLTTASNVTSGIIYVYMWLWNLNFVIFDCTLLKNKLISTTTAATASAAATAAAAVICSLWIHVFHWPNASGSYRYSEYNILITSNQLNSRRTTMESINWCDVMASQIPPTPIFVQQLLQTQFNENTKAPHYWSFWTSSAESISMSSCHQWNLSVTTTSIIRFVSSDLFSNVF